MFGFDFGFGADSGYTNKRKETRLSCSDGCTCKPTILHVSTRSEPEENRAGSNLMV